MTCRLARRLARRLLPPARLSILPLALLLAAGPAAAAETRAFVLTTDYSTGSLSVVDLATRAVTPDVAPVHSDAVARWYDGLLYVVNRLGQDNIQVLDPAAGYATIRQFSVGNGTNPQDIAFVSPTRAYVSRLGSPALLIVNPATGATLGTVSLAAFADADGNPEAARMIRVGPLLFVALQRLANFQPTDTSLVAIVDTRADTVYDADPLTPGRQAVVLAGKNPVTTFAYDPVENRLLIGCAGHYGVLDGGIEAISLGGWGAPQPQAIQGTGFVITEAALGGDVLDFAWQRPSAAWPHHHYAIVSDASYDTRLVSWSDATHAVLGTLFDPGGFSLADCALDDRGELYVCDNSFAAPGLFVFRAGADTLLAGPLDTGLPPQLVVFDDPRPEDDVAGIPVARTGLSLAAPWPNPARDATRIALSLAQGGMVRVEALDVAGRRVRTLLEGELPAGRTSIEWRFNRAGGTPIGSGVYFVRAAAGNATLTRRVVVLR